MAIDYENIEEYVSSFIQFAFKEHCISMDFTSLLTEILLYKISELYKNGIKITQIIYIPDDYYWLDDPPRPRGLFLMCNKDCVDTIPHKLVRRMLDAVEEFQRIKAALYWHHINNDIVFEKEDKNNVD